LKGRGKWGSKKYKRAKSFEINLDTDAINSSFNSLQNSFKQRKQKKGTEAEDYGDQDCVFIAERSPSEIKLEVTEAESQLLTDRNVQTVEATHTIYRTIYITLTDENLCSETRL
jgi:hypothetical protein